MGKLSFHKAFSTGKGAYWNSDEKTFNLDLLTLYIRYPIPWRSIQTFEFLRLTMSEYKVYILRNLLQRENLNQFLDCIFGIYNKC